MPILLRRSQLLLGRPFPGIELFDRVADTVFFIKDQEGRYVAVNETLVHRCGFMDKDRS